MTEVVAQIVIRQHTVWIYLDKYLLKIQGQEFREDLCWLEGSVDGVD